MPFNCSFKCKTFSDIYRSKLGFYDSDGTDRPKKSCSECNFYLFTNDIKCPCCKKRYKTMRKVSNYKYKTLGFIIKKDPNTGEIIRIRKIPEIETTLLAEQLLQSYTLT
jgi:hypothetical protein